MLQLSVIIVSYNVEAFLKQCLFSVLKSSGSISAEIIVVDNNSIDNSVKMVRENFKDVILICNSENKGFAYACNQALKISKAKYSLLLNPDTIVQENTFSACIDFMEKTPSAGALGVKMINGEGKFLPESKRSLPNPATAFYKIFGLTKLFPKSELFGRYHLRSLDENKTQKVEVLSGAFMFIRHSVLEQIGLLDETFFMYGEDIDLSYRITLSGYDNYYFPETTIIHYKGQSTKKSGFKYVRNFYNAMLIFANKHYKGKKRSIFMFLIYIAIYFRASLTLFQQVFLKSILPLADILLFYTGYMAAIPFWEKIKFSTVNYYSPNFLHYYVPAFITIWILFIKYFGGYEKNPKIKSLIKAILTGTMVILAVYSLLPEQYRYSRALILIGSGMALTFSILNRFIQRLIYNKGKGISEKVRKKAILIGSHNHWIIKNQPEIILNDYEICHALSIDENTEIESTTLNEIIKIHKTECIIFLIQGIEIGMIINIILKIKQNQEFKIILPESSSVIGQQSVINLDSLSQFNINPIDKPINLTTKRIIDLVFMFVSVPLIPIFLIKSQPVFVLKIFKELLKGQKTWVSFYQNDEKFIKNLPRIKKGIFNVAVSFSGKKFNDEELKELNLRYARNYKSINEIKLISKGLLILALKGERFLSTNLHIIDKERI
ncbi:MAG: glycosyltransferase [Bacteroidales bacterium]